MTGTAVSDVPVRACPTIAERVAAVCLENKLIILTCGSHGHVLRLIPPLNMSDEDADKGMSIIEKAINSLK